MTYKSIFITLFIGMLAYITVGVSHADDIRITTCNFASVQSAIAQANTLDQAVIQFDCDGIISFPTQLSITGDVHLIGNEKIILDGGGRTRLFYVADGASFTLENVTIQKGYATEFGGAVLNDGGLLTIHQTLFRDNEAGSGGAIYNFGAMTITDSHFMQNSGYYGGAIYNDESDATITNTYFFQNDSFYGSVIYNEDGVVSLANAKLLQNMITSYSLGSYLFNTEDALIDIRSSDIYPQWSDYSTVVNPLGTFISQDTYYRGVDCKEGSITDNGGNTVQGGDGCPGDEPTTPTDVVVTDCDHFFGSGTLLEAIVITNKVGGTITFACSGTITFLHQVRIFNNVTINGGGNVILDGDGKTSLFRGAGTLYLDGLTFQNGVRQGSDAGGIDAFGDLTIINCIFINNENAIVHDEQLTIHNSVFTDNLYRAIVVNGDFTLTDSTFTNNPNGAILLSYTNDTTSASISNSTFTNNDIEGNGGAIAVYRKVHLTITDSTFTGNTAGENGGAIYMRGAFTTIQNSTFTDNTAGMNGGAFFHELDRWSDGAVLSENGVYTNNTCVSEINITDLGGNTAENAAGCPNS